MQEEHDFCKDCTAMMFVENRLLAERWWWGERLGNLQLRQEMELSGRRWAIPAEHCWGCRFMSQNKFFLFRFFWCGPFLKSSLNLLQYCFCFGFLVQRLWSLAPCRIEPAPPALEVQSLNHWTSREVPQVSFICCFNLVCFTVVCYVAVSNWTSLFKGNIKL